MGNNGNGNGSRGFDNKLTLTRRDFLKTTAAAAAAGGILEATATTPAYAVVPSATPAPPDQTYTTTCLCCSVGCGQLVDVKDGAVTDIYGDPNHVVNAAANCPKGAAAILNVTGDRRLGVDNNVVSAAPYGVSGTGAPYLSVGPWKRTGNGAWTHVEWDAAMNEIASGMVTARSAYASANANTTPVNGIDGFLSNNGVAFFGCSHATDEENYLYRKIIANFGSNNTEHQARI